MLRLASIAHFNGRRPAAADTAIHKAISLNPEDSGHWRHLAWMCYSQGDRKAGLKWALKARELSPRDPGALNLIALCQPKDREGQEARRQYLAEALELRPNDPNLQNNLGVQYLNEPKDYAAAEACFRRSLSVNPTSALYRKNLFLAIKGRDWIYKALCAPRDLVYRFVRAVRPTGWKRYALLPALIVLWLVVGRYLYAVLILWAIFAWPMIKVYEYLTLGDLKKEGVGEIGALRGGFMGYRSWSLRTRLGIFAIILAGFWTGMIFAFRAAAGGNPKATFTLLGAAIAVLIGFVVALIRRRKGMLRNPLHAWQRNKKFNKILRNSDLGPGPQKMDATTIKLLEKALAASPADWETREHLMVHYLDAGGLQRAAELLKEAPSPPDTEGRRLVAARIQVELNADAALPLLESILASNRGCAPAYLLLARYYHQRGLNDEAKRKYGAATVIDPSVADPRFEAMLGLVPMPSPAPPQSPSPPGIPMMSRRARRRW